MNISVANFSNFSLINMGTNALQNLQNKGVSLNKVNPYQNNAATKAVELINKRFDSIEISQEAVEMHKTMLREAEMNSKISSDEEIHQDRFRQVAEITKNMMKSLDPVFEKGLAQLDKLENGSEEEKNNARVVLNSIKEIVDFTGEIANKDLFNQVHNGKEVFDQIFTEIAKDSEVAEKLNKIDSLYQENTGSKESGFLKISTNALGLNDIENLSADQVKEKLTAARESVSLQLDVMNKFTEKFEDMLDKGEISFGEIGVEASAEEVDLSIIQDLENLQQLVENFDSQQ